MAHTESISRLIALLLFLWPAGAYGQEMELGLLLHNRFTLERNGVERLLRYDPSTSAFDTASYLNPTTDDTFYSFLARVDFAITPVDWLTFALTIDTGDSRPNGIRPAMKTLELQRLAALLDNPEVISVHDERLPLTVNGRELAVEARDTLFLRQAYATFQGGEEDWFRIDLGMRYASVGGGLIYEDYGLATQLITDFDRNTDLPLRASATVMLPTRTFSEGLHSPLVELRVDHVFSFMESLGLLFAYYKDGDNNFGQMFLPQISELAVSTQDAWGAQLHREVFGVTTAMGTESEADLFWLGLDGNKLIGDLMLSGTALVQFGKLQLMNPFAELVMLADAMGMKAPAGIPREEVIEQATLGIAIDLSAQYLLTESFALGAFFVYLSGEENPFLSEGTDTTYNSYLGVMPYLTHTHIFFSGGMNETFSGRRATSSGINGRGVVATGANVDLAITEGAILASTAAVLFADRSSQSGGSFYGVEVDLQAGYRFTDWFSASMQYGFLVPGDFFRSNDVTHQLLVGADLTYN